MISCNFIRLQCVRGVGGGRECTPSEPKPCKYLKSTNFLLQAAAIHNFSKHFRSNIFNIFWGEFTNLQIHIEIESPFGKSFTTIGICKFPPKNCKFIQYITKPNFSFIISYYFCTFTQETAKLENSEAQHGF